MRTAVVAATLSLGVSGLLGQSRPRLDAVVHGATFKPAVAEATWTSVFGQFPIVCPDSANQSFGHFIPEEQRFSTQACNLEVLVKAEGTEEKAQISYAGANQINFLMPKGTGERTISVLADGVESNARKTTVRAMQPGFFRTGIHLPAVNIFQGGAITYQTPLTAGKEEIITFWLTGAGTSTVADPTRTTPYDTLYHIPTPKVLLDGVELGQQRVLFAGLSPGYIGLHQLNITLPALPAGTSSLTACVQDGENELCDTVDLIARDPAQPYAVGNISDIHHDAGKFRGTIERNGKTATIETGERGNFLLQGDIVADGKLTGSTITITESKPGVYAKATFAFDDRIDQEFFYRQMLPWNEDEIVNVSFRPQKWANIQRIEGSPDPVTNLILDQQNSIQPLNNIIIHKFRMLTGEGIIDQTYTPSFPGALSIYIGNLSEVLQEKLRNCIEQDTSALSRLGILTDQPAKDSPLTQVVTPYPPGSLTGGQSSSNKVEAIGRGRRYAEYHSNIDLIDYGTNWPTWALQANFCPAWYHEFAHNVLRIHLPGNHNLMYYATGGTENFSNLENATLRQVFDLDPRTFDPSEHSHLESTAPLGTKPDGSAWFVKKSY